jgi:hypothetical protein
MSESGREREKKSYALDSLSQLFVYKQFPPMTFCKKLIFHVLRSHRALSLAIIDFSEFAHRSLTVA